MRRIVVLAVFGLLAVTPAVQAAKPAAPGAPGAIHTWAPADKHGYGTAAKDHGATTESSPIAFTLRQAMLTDVYWPDLSTPSFRGLQFAVVDGTTVTRETVDDDPRHIERVSPGVTASVDALDGTLAYRQVTSTSRWRLTKTWITDPARATVLARVRFEALQGAPQLYVLADPAPGDDGNDDKGTSGPTTLVASDDAGATTVAADPPLSDTSSGYRGTASDPWQDLQDGTLKGYDAKKAGNVVQGARTALDGITAQDMTLAIGFGKDAAAANAAAAGSLASGFAAAQSAFDGGWAAYGATLKAPPASVASDPAMLRLYKHSTLVLAGLEDKTYRGAGIASPSMPWIWGTLTLEPNRQHSGPYHLVWPRDLYHAATAQKLAGDDEAARRQVEYLWSVQKADGSFWQNTFVNRQEKWTTEQMDQVGLPIVLAWWLGMTSDEDWRHVKRAADYIVANGPVSDNERWENQSGYSPNTIAAEIAGLICAADIARRNGDGASAARYEKTADAWQKSVENWTATRNGPYSSKPYYLRVTKDGNPNNGSTYTLGDNYRSPDGSTSEIDERRVVDNSFLGLTLWGVKPWNDATIVNSLEVGDNAGPFPLAAKTPSGTFWHRFTYDGYGEQHNGDDWDLFFDNPNNQTRGRVWPLLAGERAEYELLAGQTAAATPRLRHIANTANDGLMLPEQVWDDKPPPGETSGKGDRSGTPLAWTHGAFVRLAWSIDAGVPLERPSIVACRYTGADCAG
jgi:glucoamylase